MTGDPRDPTFQKIQGMQQYQATEKTLVSNSRFRGSSPDGFVLSLLLKPGEPRGMSTTQKSLHAVHTQCTWLRLDRGKHQHIPCSSSARSAFPRNRAISASASAAVSRSCCTSFSEHKPALLWPWLSCALLCTLLRELATASICCCAFAFHISTSSRRDVTKAASGSNDSVRADWKSLYYLQILSKNRGR